MEIYWTFFLVILLRGLDALTTEESVSSALKAHSNPAAKSVRIGRDGLTNTSRGLCYVEMTTVGEAIALHNQLLAEPLAIDGKLVSVNYSKSGSSGVVGGANAALEAAQWSQGEFRLNDASFFCTMTPYRTVA